MAKLEEKHKDAIEALMLITQYSCAMEQLLKAAGDLPEEYSHVLISTGNLSSLFDKTVEGQMDKYIIKE